MKKIKKPVSILLAFIMVVSLFTIVPVTASAAAASDAHFSQDGDTYTIHDAEGWNVFCDLLDADNGKTYFSGKTVNLGADISVTRMAGGSQHDFTGTFDGQEHTLTVSYGSETEPVSNDDKTAPFRNAESGCVIKNLHTAGTIYTSKKYAGGFIGTQYGTVKIENCRSSVTINSLTAGDGTHGGFVGNNGNGSDLTIDGCVFDGKILSAGETATTSCSGFVGYKHNSGTITLTNCVYDPAALEAGETEVSANSATFVRNGSAGNNCYYTRTLGDAQGKQTHTITADNDVTLALCGDATAYNVSGITAYENNSGLQYNDQTYAGENDAVTLTLGYTRPAGYAFTGYTVSAGTLTDNVLTMPAGNVTVNAGFEQALYTVTIAPTTHGSVLSTKGAANYDEYVALLSFPEQGYYLKTVYINGTVLEPQGGSYTFYMPDEDVTVTAEFAKKPVSVTYLDENGAEHMVQATPLDPSMTTLEEGWYVVNSNVVYTSSITFSGKVNLILADGCTMSVGTEEVPITSQNAICSTETGSFTVYGQSSGSGTLKAYAYADDRAAFYARLGVYTQNGGNVIIRTTGDNASGFSGNGFVLNRGSFDAATTGKNAPAIYALSSIRINGGNLKALCEYTGSTQSSYGLSAGIGNIYLGYRSAEDSIQASSLNVANGRIAHANIEIVEGKTFTDGTNFYDSNTASATLEALTNVTLTPVAYDVTVSDCTNGSVTAQAKAAKDETVTLTVNPDYGYAVTGVTVNGTAIEPVNGVYSFTMPAQNVTVSAEFTFSDGVGARLVGHSISLQGDIGVNFYMELAPEIAQSQTAYMLFTIPNGDNPYTAKVYVNEQSDATLPHAVKNGNYYVFKCNVAAKEMTSQIKAQIYDGETPLGNEYNYSVEDYANYLLSNADEYGTPEQQEYYRAAPLVRAMLRYGAYAKEYFDKTNTLPDLDDVNINIDDPVIGEFPEGTTFDGATLSLKSKTSLSLYLTSNAEGLTFTCTEYSADGQPVREMTVEPVETETGSIARIRDIAASELKNNFTLTVKSGETVLGTITYSPMNYCYKALHGGTTDERLINAVKALVAYADAAKVYFG